MKLLSRRPATGGGTRALSPYHVNLRGRLSALHRRYQGATGVPTRPQPTRLPDGWAGQTGRREAAAGRAGGRWTWAERQVQVAAAATRVAVATVAARSSSSSASASCFPLGLPRCQERPN